MDQRIRRLITMGAVALVCLLLVSVPVPAQQPDPLQAAFSALGARGSRRCVSRVSARRMPADRRVPLTTLRGRHRPRRRRASSRRRARPTPRSARCRGAPRCRSPRAVRRSSASSTSATRSIASRPGWTAEGVGDTMVETLFRDYERTPGGVLFPRHITQSQGGRPRSTCGCRQSVSVGRGFSRA